MYEWQFRCYVPFKKIEILKLDHLFFIDQSRSLDLSFEPQGTVLDIKSQRFGKCLDCKSQRTAVAWCKNCDIAFFKEKFSNWTSVWMEGPRWNLDEESELWSRNGPIKVILKRLDNSHNMSQEFVNQLYRYHKCLQSDALADCFDANPLNRPTASQIYECLGNWITAICDDPNRSDLSDQFDAAEEFKFANLEKLNYNVLPCHEGAIYFSRLLSFSDI
ncbi:unnamed protein product [Rhizophagus irregularis]|nr:unnamed protein product [Rhizophagus irregularis]